MGHRLNCFKPALGEVLPQDWQDYDGLIVFGGPMSVNDQSPGVLDELARVEQWLAQDRLFGRVLRGANVG